MYDVTFESADPSDSRWMRAIIVYDGNRLVGPVFSSSPAVKGQATTPEQVKAGQTLWAMIKNMEIRR